MVGTLDDQALQPGDYICYPVMSLIYYALEPDNCHTIIEHQIR